MNTSDVARGRRRAALRSLWPGYVAALLACAATTGIAALLTWYFDLVNIIALFLLTMVLIAVGFGRGPGVMASFLSVALFDFFFIPPRFSLTVADAQYLLTFAVMLVVALITAHLTADLKQQASVASQKERRTRALYEMARELAGVRTIEQAGETVRRFLRDTVQAEAVVFAEDEHHRFVPVAPGERYPDDFRGVHITPEHLDIRHLVDTAAATGNLAVFDSIAYFPMKASGRVRGVLLASFGGDPDKLQEHTELVGAVATLGAIVIERLHYGAVAAARELELQAEHQH
jgi:two-component system sensor histidine kinase KdpD